MTWWQTYIVVGLVYTCLAACRAGFDEDLRQEIRGSGFSPRFIFFCATVAAAAVVVTWPWGLGNNIYNRWFA